MTTARAVAAAGAASEPLYQRFLQTVVAANLVIDTSDRTPVTDADLTHLPGSVLRYLGFMGVVGRPRDWSFRARFSGHFRRNQKERWMPCDAWQYNAAPLPARVFFMRARLWRVLPLVARDTYVRGEGRMVGKLLDLITVVDGSGDEFDIGELVTYLNDAVLFAPSFLLGPNTTWSEVDEHTFDVTLIDAGRSVTGRVFIDDEGRPRDFSTTDRFAALPDGPVRAQWTTPIEAWAVSDGRPHPAAASAIWHFPEGPFCYIEGRFVVGGTVYNVPPNGLDVNAAPHRDQSPRGQVKRC